jgi:FdhD protein
VTLPGAVTGVQVLTCQGGHLTERADLVAVEEPLDLRVQDGGASFTLSVMMRTPGHDRELVTGWLHAEGLLDAVRAFGPLPDAPNVVQLTGDTERLRAGARAGVTSAACGVCGSGSVERLSVRAIPPRWTAPPLPAGLIRDLPRRLRAAQPGFAASGGLHAAGLFTPAGDLLAAFEDVGRHNAALRGLLPLENCVLVTSSRAGFEIVQKAALAGIPVVLTVGAPSSLAVETAAALGLTLIGFVRGERFNVYAGTGGICL